MRESDRENEEGDGELLVKTKVFIYATRTVQGTLAIAYETGSSARWDAAAN